jgi:hypothetical protein
MMTLSDDEHWNALVDGKVVEEDGVPIGLRVVDCGELLAPFGQLMICDPIATEIFWSESFAYEERLLDEHLPPLLTIRPGRYQVKVTIADVSGELDGSHPRNAYLTLCLADAAEFRREPILKYECCGRLGIGIDSAKICMVDRGILSLAVLAQIEQREKPYWYDCLEEEDHIAYGVANLDLPGLVGQANMILLTSGWGDGTCPVIGGYDAAGNLVRVHVDFCLFSHWAWGHHEAEDEEDDGLAADEN